MRAHDRGVQALRNDRTYKLSKPIHRGQGDSYVYEVEGDDLPRRVQLRVSAQYGDQAVLTWCRRHHRELVQAEGEIAIDLSSEPTFPRLPGLVTG